VGAACKRFLDAIGLNGAVSIIDRDKLEHPIAHTESG